MLYFLNPILESPKEFFCNIRKVSIGVLISIVTRPEYREDLPLLIECDVFYSCMKNIVNMTLQEVRSVFYLMIGLFNNQYNLQRYFSRYSWEQFARSIILYIQNNDISQDDYLIHYLCSLLTMLSDSRFDIKGIVRELPIEIRKDFFF